MLAVQLDTLRLEISVFKTKKSHVELEKPSIMKMVLILANHVLTHVGVANMIMETFLAIPVKPVTM